MNARKSLRELRSVAPYWVEPFTVSPLEQDIAIKARQDGSYAIAWALLKLTAVLREGRHDARFHNVASSATTHTRVNAQRAVAYDAMRSARPDHSQNPRSNAASDKRVAENNTA